MEHVAFLRGINVGGHTVKGPRLIEVFADAGFGGARTFLASGNVLFEASAIAPAAPEELEELKELEEHLEGHLLRGLGYEVPTFVRTGEEVAAIAGREPFPALAGTGKVHVAFLRAPLGLDVQERVLTFATDGDQVVFDDREMYWHVSGGFADSGLGDPALARVMGGAWTVRTASTVQRLAAKLAA